MAPNTGGLFCYRRNNSFVTASSSEQLGIAADLYASSTCKQSKANKVNFLPCQDSSPFIHFFRLALLSCCVENMEIKSYSIYLDRSIKTKRERQRERDHNLNGGPCQFCSLNNTTTQLGSRVTEIKLVNFELNFSVVWSERKCSLSSPNLSTRRVPLQPLCEFR